MLILACLWVAWCVVHSLLISRQAHELADRLLRNASGKYRLFYVTFSLISLAPILWYQFSLPQKILLQQNPVIIIIQAVLLIYGILMFYLGAGIYDMKYFLGITQWRNMQKKQKPQILPFHTDGVLSYVRHPWYSGGIAFLWGLGAITDIYFLTRTILTAYIIIGTVLEERRLEKELGTQYTQYRQKVPMLIPWKGKKALSIKNGS